MERSQLKIWKDQEGRLWTLADSGLDTEIFEAIGKPVLDEKTGLWLQQIAFRIEQA